MSRQLEVAKAVRDALNAQTFSPTFSSVLRFAPLFDLTELATRKVSVIPFGFKSAKETRSKSRRQYRIDVVVQVQLGVSQNDVTESSLEENLRLIESLQTFVEREANRSMSGAKYIGASEIDLLESYEGLVEDMHRSNVFFAAISANYIELTTTI